MTHIVKLLPRFGPIHPSIFLTSSSTRGGVTSPSPLEFELESELSSDIRCTMDTALVTLLVVFMQADSEPVLNTTLVTSLVVFMQAGSKLVTSLKNCESVSQPSQPPTVKTPAAGTKFWASKDSNCHGGVTVDRTAPTSEIGGFVTLQPLPGTTWKHAPLNPAYEQKYTYNPFPPYAPVK